MPLNQPIHRLPLKQIQHQNPQPGPLHRCPKHHSRIRRRRTRVRPITRRAHHVQDLILQQRDPQLVRQDVQPNQTIISGMGAVQVLVIERVGVEPLDEILEIVDAGFG
jgi:hypothetical protein